MPVGCLAVFRGDAFHAGAGNPSQAPERRMHAYLLCEGFSKLEVLKDAAIVSW